MTRYICLWCLHEWESTLERQGIRCSSCHRRQGVDSTKFLQVVDRAEEALTGFQLPPETGTALSAFFSLVQGIDESVIEQFPGIDPPPGVAAEVLARAAERMV